jgi:hypothetical protein
MARAIIRVDNVASQQSFERAGYISDRQVYNLFLWLPEAGKEASLPQEVVLLPVDTLTYRGLWIEGLATVSAAKQQSVVATARAMIAQQGRDNTGALISIDMMDRLVGELCAVADSPGSEYQQWVKSLGE